MRKTAVLITILLGAVAGLTFPQMMGPGGCGGFGGYGGMMGDGWWGSPPPSSAKILTLDQAAQTVNQFLKDYLNPDLEIAEVMEFDRNFYASVREKSTGVGAFELLINKWTGVISPEPGPNMMWNVKYSPMGMGMMGGGMMGGPAWGGRGGYRGWQNPTKAMPVTAEQAHAYAQQFLDARLPGTRVEKDADTFYGHYTMDVLNADGGTYGMLSVNGYSGQVWYHTWHGTYIAMKAFGEK
jgi:hypothetical protein